jgi:nucleoside-diphosphate-sugar epimerase
MIMELTGKQVLVTGATGFIGGRLVDHLVARGANVRVLVRRLQGSSRLSRFPLEVVYGDVIEAADVEKAVNKCDVIFHCAYGTSVNEEEQRNVNVGGTRNVLEASWRARVQRLVYTSTMMVYGVVPDGVLVESAPRRYSGNVYADSKLDAEKLALDYAKVKNLSVVVLQPTIVYGPYGSPWTVNVLKQLQRGRQILVNGGEGFCNTVYIDDLVNAMLLAATNGNVTGEAFLISSDEVITWRDFYCRFERMLGDGSRTVSMSAAEACAYYAETRKSSSILKETLAVLREEPQVRNRILQTREMSILTTVAKAVLPAQTWQALKGKSNSNSHANECLVTAELLKPVNPVTPFMVEFFASKARVQIDKAKRLLKYQPVFDFETGMELTEQWARWSNLL